MLLRILASLRARLKLSLLVGIFLMLPIAAALGIFSVIDGAMSQWLRHLPFLHILSSWVGGGFLVLSLLVLLIGFIATSPTFNRSIVPYTVARIPVLRWLWRWARRFAERIQRFQFRVVVVYEEYVEGSIRWRVGYLTGITSFPKSFPHPVMLSITPVPSQGIGTDPRYMPPSRRLFVVEKPYRGELVAWAFSSGTLVPESIEERGLTPFPEWVRRIAQGDPERLRKLLGQEQNGTDVSGAS